MLLAALLAGLGAGCSSEPTRYAISGTVTANGAPVALAVVKFIPAAPGADTLSGGMGVADEAGKFTIGGEPGKNTGLPAGEYKVTFSQTLVNGRPTLGGSGGKKSEKLAGEKEAVADVYRDPQSTPVTARVGRDSTTFTFEIKTK